MAVGPVAMPRTSPRPAPLPAGVARALAAEQVRRRDPDHEALANARLAAWREQRPRFEASPRLVDLYL